MWFSIQRGLATCKGADRALRCLLPSFPNRHAAQLRAQLQPTSLQRVSQKSPSKSGPDVESNPGAGKSEREGVKVSPDRERLVAKGLGTVRKGASPWSECRTGPK